MKTKLRKIGSGYGVLLPKKVIDNLRLSEGDELELTESEAGIELSPFDPDFAEQVEAFQRTEAQHRNSYRELRKKEMTAVRELTARRVRRLDVRGLIAIHRGIAGALRRRLARG